MRHMLLTLSLFLAVAVAAPAQVAPPRPGDQPPQIDPPKPGDPAKQVDPPKAGAPRPVALNVGPDGRGFVQTVVTRYQDVKQTIQVIVNGQFENRDVLVKVPVSMTVRVALDDEGVDVYDPTGVKVDGKALRFKAPVTVWVSADGKRVDPTFHKMVQPGQYIVVAPQLASVTLPQPMPLPPLPKVGPR